MPSSIYTAQSFLQRTLSAALSIPVRELGAARGLAFPYCVYDVRPTPNVRAKNSLVWSPVEATVRIVGKGSPGPLKQHVEAADDALLAELATETNVVDCTKTSDFRLPIYRLQGEEEPMQEIGGKYRLRVREG